MNLFMKQKGFAGGSSGKESACQAGNVGSMPELGRSPGLRNGNPLPWEILGIPMDRGVWRDTVHGATKSRTQLSN